MWPGTPLGAVAAPGNKPVGFSCLMKLHSSVERQEVNMRNNYIS